MFLAARRALKMPLRARINPKMLPNYSTASTPSAPADDEVLFSTNGAVRTVTLNRPRKLNAINRNMCDLILPRLLEYAKSDLTGSVVIKGAGGKALSAGGDVASVAMLGKEVGLEKAIKINSDFFKDEFGLDHAIATYEKPYVSLWDGIVMGGGVGLTAHGSFRVATEKTMVSMPETSIGYYPDVGGLFFLSHLNGQLGLFAALTSHRFRGYDAYRLGLATHYVSHEMVAQVEQRLTELEPAGIPAKEYFTLVNAAIEDYASEPPTDYSPGLSATDLDIIDVAFAKDTVEEILESLESQSERSPSFVAETVKTLQARSPLSLKVTLKAYRKIAKLDLVAAFNEEMKICQHFMASPNFVEGVTALLVEKRPVKWDPATLSEVTPELVDSFFETPADPVQVAFTNDRTFTNYPHRFGLPSQQDVMDFVTGETSTIETKATRNDVIQHFSKQYPGSMKLGLSQYLNELLDRKTTPDSEDSTLLDWNY